MKLEDALPLAEKVCAVLRPFCERVVVAGSIRRGKAEVGDIDIVALPKCMDLPGALGGTAHFNESQVWKGMLPMALMKLGLRVEASGQELLRFSFVEPELQVDVYRARPDTWGVILLVRTGSKEHNVKLCTLARSKGLKLSAAEGVVAQDGFGSIVACRTEESIFSALGLAYVEPKDRRLGTFEQERRSLPQES
jgi:DNA polymerase (family 10)